MNKDSTSMAERRSGYVNRCPTCDSSSIEVLYPDINVWTCSACHMRFRNPQPTEDDLIVFYNGAFGTENVVTHKTGMEGTTAELARQYVAHLEAKVGIAGKKVMEFGAGLGITCRALRDHGADVTAVEPFAWRECEKLGITTYRSLDELPQDLKFDAILSLQVVEHLCSPQSVLRGLRDRLQSGGWLYLATPNAGGLRARLHGSRWKELARYGHVLFYSPSTLETALRQAGFRECTRVREHVRYTQNPAKNLAQYALQVAGLEGELRYLAREA